MNLPLVELLLVGVLLMTSRNFWVSFKTRYKKSHFYQSIVNYFNIYIGIHALYILITENLFHEIPFLYKFPFSLLYGPFLCFILIAQKHNRLSKRVVLGHIMPFTFFLFWFVTILGLGVLPSLWNPYSAVLSFCSLLSFSGYAIWSIRYVTYDLKYKAFTQRPLFLVGFMLLLFMSSIALAYIFYYEKLNSTDTARELFLSMIYSCMLGTTYLISSDMRRSRRSANDKNEEQNQTLELKYKKSLLPQERLDAYAKALDGIMQHDKVYLNPDLSLQHLAELLNIPTHHLTQVFNVKLRTSFHEYVNTFRIEEARTLLVAQKNTPIEIIAQRCGFNSKSSFNRNFKASQGSTPSEYRLSRQ